MSTFKELNPVLVEALSVAITEALVRGEKSSAEKGNCMYRNEDGNKCLVGRLIKDEYYMEDMESGACAGAEIIQDALEQSLSIEISRTERKLLQALQTAHDNCDKYNFREHFTIQLKDLEIPWITYVVDKFIEDNKETNNGY